MRNRKKQRKYLPHLVLGLFLLFLISVLLFFGLSLNNYEPNDHLYTPYDDGVVTINKSAFKSHNLSLIYSEKSKVLKLLSGSRSPIEIYNYSKDIYALEMMPWGDLLITDSLLFSPETSFTYDIGYDQFKFLAEYNSNFYSKLNDQGGMDIYENSYHGDVKVLGTIPRSKFLEVNCIKQSLCTFPYDELAYQPSRNSSFLLAGWPIVGGGQPTFYPVYVITSDGSQIYDVGSRLPNTSVVWLSDNRLLLVDENKKVKILTFDFDGSFKEKEIDIPVRDTIQYDRVSPSGRFILYESNSVNLYDLQNNEIIDISQLVTKADKSIYPMDDGSHLLRTYQFMNWTKDSSKMIFAVTSSAVKGSDREGQLLSKKIMVYSVNSGKIDTLAYFGKNNRRLLSNTLQLEYTDNYNLRLIFY